MLQTADDSWRHLADHVRFDLKGVEEAADPARHGNGKGAIAAAELDHVADIGPDGEAVQNERNAKEALPVVLFRHAAVTHLH